MKSGADIDWKKDLPNFNWGKEFVEHDIDLGLVDARVFLYAQKIRTAINAPISPSWAKGGTGFHRANSLSSQHSCIGRLSTAGDWFPERGFVFKAWLSAIQCDEIGGIGLYNDTTGNDGKPQDMFHIDFRDYRIIWIRDNGEYIYYHKEPDKFLTVLKGFI